MSVVMIFVHVKIENSTQYRPLAKSPDFTPTLTQSSSIECGYWRCNSIHDTLYCNFTNLKIINHQQVQVSRRVDAKACLLNPTGCCSNGKSLLFSTFPNVLSLFDQPIWAIFGCESSPISRNVRSCVRPCVRPLVDKCKIRLIKAK